MACEGSDLECRVEFGAIADEQPNYLYVSSTRSSLQGRTILSSTDIYIGLRISKVSGCSHKTKRLE